MEPDPRWREAPLDQLADHIEGTHHAYLHRELPLLGQLFTDAVRQHWRQYPGLLKTHTLFARVRALIEQHLLKEETAGFPLIRAHGRDATRSLAPFSDSIESHIEEHAAITALFTQLQDELWGDQPPADLAPDLATLLQRLRALGDDLAAHIQLEDKTLFPRIRAASQAH